MRIKYYPAFCAFCASGTPEAGTLIASEDTTPLLHNMLDLPDAAPNTQDAPDAVPNTQDAPDAARNTQDAPDAAPNTQDVPDAAPNTQEAI